MGQLTITTPEGFGQLDPQERARVESRISRLLAEAIAEHNGSGRPGRLMDLYGSLKSDIPRASDEEERAAAERYVADNFLGRNT